MPVKHYKPTTFGRRGASVDSYEDLTASKPQKSLLKKKIRISGRNSQGKITVRHRGGGHKRMIRVVDARRDKYDVPANVATIEYDPNRNGRIALLHYKDGEKRYILAADKLKVGDTVLSSMAKIEAANGNRMPLVHVPIGLMVHDIELSPRAGGKMAKSAGNSAQLMAVDTYSGGSWQPLFTLGVNS